MCQPLVVKNPTDLCVADRCIRLQDKSIGHWRFSCVMSFSWRPILSGDSSLVEVSQNQGLIPGGPSMLLLSSVRWLFLCVFCSGPDKVFTVVPLFQQLGTRNTTSVLNRGRCAGTENFMHLCSAIL
jgi:hypothetical protein